MTTTRAPYVTHSAVAGDVAVVGHYQIESHYLNSAPALLETAGGVAPRRRRSEMQSKAIKPLPLTLEQVGRFWAKVDRSGKCWEWRGAKQRGGYGVWGVGGKRVARAHRIAYMLAHGDIPSGHEVIHLCDNAGCVNPSHLTIGAHSANMADLRLRYRGLKAALPATTWRLPAVFEEAIRAVAPEALFWKRVTTCAAGECWLWQGAASKRHGYGTLIRGGKVLKAHRYAWQITHGPIPAGLDVCHRCDVRLCVNPSHLFLGTRRDNIRDMWAKGRAHPPPLARKGRDTTHYLRGERHHKARLTDAHIREARRRVANGEPASAIARGWGVDRHTVARAVYGKAWSHVV